jgi:hypothetical protein
MARVTYQDEGITEYDDGTEEVRFTDAEWERMLADPAFGYVHRCGHPTSAGERRAMETGLGDTHCHRCENEAEAICYAIEDAEAEHGRVTTRTLASGSLALVGADGRVVEILRGL